MRTLPLLSFALLLAAGGAKAQDGPSFDCRFAGTTTEVAICDSPRLARIERWVVEAYENLADRIGEGEARGIADRQLAERQACEGDPACIEERLILTLQAFEESGADVGLPLEEGPEPPVIVRLPEPSPLTEPAPEPEREPEAAPPRAGFEALSPDERLALGPPVELSQEAALPEPAAPALEAALAPLEEPDAAPGSASTLAEAFADLPSYRRTNVQGRLAEAGYSAAPADGVWGPATQAGLAAFALDAVEHGRPFDVSTPDGAAALLDFLDSDAFKRTFLGEGVALVPEW